MIQISPVRSAGWLVRIFRELKVRFNFRAGFGRLRNRRDPCAKVVVRGHAGDFAVRDFENCGGGNGVPLAGCFGETVIGSDVLAVHNEFGCAVVAVGHEDQVADLFAVAGVHTGFECPVRIDANLATAFVDVVSDIFGKSGEHAFEIVAVECVEIGTHEGFGFVH